MEPPIPSQRSRSAERSQFWFRYLLCAGVFTFGVTSSPAQAPIKVPSVAPAPGESPANAVEDPNYQSGVADNLTVGVLPEHTKELSKRAAAAFARGDWDEAREVYLEMLEAEPSNALVLTNLGSVEQRSGDLGSARKFLERATVANPELAQAWLLLGLVHFDREETNLAIGALCRAVHEDPFDARAHNYLGVVIKSIGWTTGAEEELRRAIELDPTYAGAHFNLALMYLERQPPALELAKRHYDKARNLGAKKDPLVEKRLQGK